MMQRRDFIAATVVSSGILCCPRFIFADEGQTPAPVKPRHDKYLRPARFYEQLEDKIVECRLCPRRCRVSDLERGYCGVRENIAGDYFTLVYSRACTANIDPIEKKPFYHFLPGTTAFSIATAGCNLNCKFCQNWNISQFRPEDVSSFELPPDECALAAYKNNCKSVAYTYSEPTVFYEYMADCAVSARKTGLRSVVVSAGYIEKAPLQELLGLVDAIKIDLKAFSQTYYSDICSGELKPILETLLTIKETGTWLEIVYLMLPGLNDSEGEISALCDWLISNLGPDVPIHFTRFHPAYLLKNLPITSLESLERAYDIGRAKGLHFPYIGNVYGHKAENTFCPECGKLLIARKGLQVTENILDHGKCPACQYLIPGVWT